MARRLDEEDLGRRLACCSRELRCRTYRAWQALVLAARHGNVPLLRALLEASLASVDSTDNGEGTALLSAAFHGCAAAVQALLEAGAEVDAVNSPALDTAARHGCAAAVQALPAPGADIVVADIFHSRPLITGAKRGDVVQALLDTGCWHQHHQRIKP